MTEEAEPMMRLLRWCGIALVVAGVLVVVATLLHPSRETAATIIATEPRLVAAHTVYAFAWFFVLLGLPGLYAAQRGRMGRLGLAGFLVAMLHLSDRGHGILRVYGASLGQGGACRARYPPIRPNRRFQRIGRGCLHRWLRIVRHRHDPDGDPARPVRRARRGWRSYASARVWPISARFYCGLGGRRSGSREPWRRPGVAWLSAVAGAGSSPSALF